jgi:hypothetical protein
MSTGGTTNKNRNSLFYRLLRFFFDFLVTYWQQILCFLVKIKS